MSRFTHTVLARLGIQEKGREQLGPVWDRASARLRLAARHGPAAEPPTDSAVLELNSSVPVCASINAPRMTTESFAPSTPGGLPALRAAVAMMLDLEASANVLVTSGATGAYLAALEAFVDPGQAVVLLAPCSPLFARAAVAHGARVRWVPTHVERGRLRVDFDTLSRAMRGAALVAVADPGNPIGVPLADDDADRLRWTADRSDVLLYVDETFARFRTDSRRLPELAPHRTLVAGSLAARGYAGLRVGWLAGASPLVAACRMARSTSESPGICQQVAVRVLATGTTVDDVVAVRAATRDTADRLHGMGLRVEEPIDGYFLWVDVGQSGKQFADRLLNAEGVRVGPGEHYGPGGERFVRLSAVADSGRLREGLNRIARFVGSPARPEPSGLPTSTRRPEFSRG